MNRQASKSRLIALCLGLAAAIGAGTAGAQYRDDRYVPPPSYSQRYDDDRHDDRHGDYDRGRGGITDGYVLRRVQVALNRTLGPAARGIGVRVNSGNVYLSGYVRDRRDREVARDVASDVRGVRQVFARRLRVGYY